MRIHESFCKTMSKFSDIPCVSNSERSLAPAALVDGHRCKRRAAMRALGRDGWDGAAAVVTEARDPGVGTDFARVALQREDAAAEKRQDNDEERDQCIYE
jgi:hypothetical protein